MLAFIIIIPALTFFPKFSFLPWPCGVNTLVLRRLPWYQRALWEELSADLSPDRRLQQQQQRGAVIAKAASVRPWADGSCAQGLHRERPSCVLADVISVTRSLRY